MGLPTGTQFTCSETYGEKPISEWLRLKLPHWIKEKYGLEVTAAVNPACLKREGLLEEKER